MKAKPPARIKFTRGPSFHRPTDASFEPAIVSESASVGRWDEGPLVSLIRGGGFAFMITKDDTPGASPHRTSAVDAAMREAYPRVERVGALWLHLPLP